MWQYHFLVQNLLRTLNMVMRKINVPVHSILGFTIWLLLTGWPHSGQFSLFFLHTMHFQPHVIPVHWSASLTLVLLVKSHSFFQSQIEVNLQFPDFLGLLLYSPWRSRSTCWFWQLSCCDTVIVFTCFSQPAACTLTAETSLSISAFLTPNPVSLQIQVTRRHTLYSILCWSKGYIFRRLIWQLYESNSSV